MFASIFPSPRPVIAVIHVGALPGTPAGGASVAELVGHAREEARLYKTCGVNGIIIENMHDVPYLRGGVGPEIVAAMTAIGLAVKDESALPVGIQILAGANRDALAVAHAAGLDMIRVEGYVFAHVADEGWIESSAAELLRYRKMIGAENVDVWADIKKKHAAHAVTSDIGPGVTAEAAEFMKADAVIVTGGTTGSPPLGSDIEDVRAHCRLPIVLGSGVDIENIANFHSAADGFIIGSSFKRDGYWANPIDSTRVKRFMEKVGGFS